MMQQAYMSRRRAENSPPAQKALETAVPGPSLQELAAGAAPSREQMGRRVDLSEVVRAKMEASFGADFSNVKLYESQTVADAGADAMAMGASIGFAPGKLDFGSAAGQAMLGHELSHVVSQARGEVSGSGFLADAGLEARADREGALAAAGESVYSGPVTPISNTSTALPAAGPMQAVGKREKEQIQAERNLATRRREGGNEDLITEAPSFFHPFKRKALRDQYDAEEPQRDAINQAEAEREQRNATLKTERNQKRPWEMSAQDFADNHFNPGDIDEISAAQTSINDAKTPEAAYNAFMQYTGNTGGNKLLTKGWSWRAHSVDLELFKEKLKNMTRMIHDYPELRDKIGDMEMYRADLSSTAMSALPVIPGRTQNGIDMNRSRLTYNVSSDREGFFGKRKRESTRAQERISGFSAADTSYDGNHELGHTLNSLILDSSGIYLSDTNNRINDWNNANTADKMVRKVLDNMHVTYPTDSSGHAELGGMHSRNPASDYTSGYGQTNAAEFFAEAIADVYAHGENARPVSIALVQEYERRRPAPGP